MKNISNLPKKFCEFPPWIKHAVYMYLDSVCVCEMDKERESQTTDRQIDKYSEKKCHGKEKPEWKCTKKKKIFLKRKICGI